MVLKSKREFYAWGRKYLAFKKNLNKFCKQYMYIYDNINDIHVNT